MTRQEYLPSLLMTERNGTVIISQAISEAAAVLGRTRKHAKNRHSKAIGVREKTHVTINTSMGMASKDYNKQLHKHFPLDFWNYKISNHKI